MNRIILSIGSNLGNRLENLYLATEELRIAGCTLRSESSVYETEPWGNTDQPSFLNKVIVVDSDLPPNGMMNEILNIEKMTGRVRIHKWEPRILDIDILFFNDEVINQNELVIPHPRLQERKFVLVPLAEILPGFIHPLYQKPVSVLLDQVNDPLRVELYKSKLA